MLKRLILMALVLSVLTTAYAQDTDICERDAVIQAFAEADDLREWAAGYAECPENVRRAVDTLVAGSDLLQSEFLVFASAADEFSFSPIWKFYQGSSASRVYNIDATTNTLTLFGDSNTEQSGDVTTAPVLAYSYKGDFTAEVIMDFSPVGAEHGAGFGVRSLNNPNQWLRLTRVGDNLELTVNEGGEVSTVKTLSYQGESSRVYLRIARNSGSFTVSYSMNGDEWTALAEGYVFSLPDEVEIFLTAFWEQPGGAASASFSEFSVQ